MSRRNDERSHGQTTLSLLALAILGFAGALDWLLPADRELGTETRILGRTEYPVFALAFSPDGMQLPGAGGFPGRDGDVKLWDVARGTLRAALYGHRTCVQSVRFASDGRTLATAGFEGLVKLWDVTSARKRDGPPILSACRGLPLAFSSAGQVLAFTGCAPGVVMPGYVRGEVLLWRLATQPENSLADSSGPATFAHEGQCLAVWRVNPGSGPSTHPSAVAMPNPAGKMRHGLKLVRWDVNLGQPTLVLRGHEDSVWSLAFSPDGRMLATASTDKTVRLWDVATGRQRAILRGHTAQVHGVALAPDGKRLASASHDRTVRIWDAASGCEEALFRGHTGAVMCVAFAPNGRWIASGSYDKPVRLWPLPLEW